MNSLSFSNFTGMPPLAALFIDNSFTIPLTKSSLIGLNENLFAVLIFCLIYVTLGWSLFFQYCHKCYRQFFVTVQKNQKIK